jgi:hypothetical protein
MDLGSIFLILALAILVILLVSRPFLEAPGRPEKITAEENEKTPASGSEESPVSDPGQAHPDRSALLAERERLISALQELEFDHELGKIPAEDYPAERMALLEAGANVLRQLDADEARELAVKQEADLSSPSTQPSSARIEIDELENMIAAHRRTHKESTTGFCPKCGNPVHKSDRFCSRCGAEIHPVKSRS